MSKTIDRAKYSKDDIINLLMTEGPGEQELLRQSACKVMKENTGGDVFLRGLVEFSNYCINDCYYCGIRKSNKNISRYLVKQEEIIETAKWCADNGFGSFVLQSGERSDEDFISFVEQVVKKVKMETRSDILPEGLGITLCVGEQDEETYRRFFEAGAHRYLLRIETTNPELYRKIHPGTMSLEKRKECLRSLKRIGYQTGTGVMIGFPGQTVEDLAADIIFFRNMDVDMIGMGPYIIHAGSPMSIYSEDMRKLSEQRYNLALRMLAATRIVLEDVNIASTTALEAMKPDGREDGLRYGANVIMPLLTPGYVRQQYKLYEGKPGLEKNSGEALESIRQSIESAGRRLALNDWGDARHFFKRK